MTQRDGPRDPHRGPTQGTHTEGTHTGDPNRGPTQRGGPHRGPTTGDEGHTGDPHRTHTDTIKEVLHAKNGIDQGTILG